MQTESCRDERTARRAELYDALATLRDGAEGHARDRAWTTVYRYIRRVLPDDRAADARQDALVAILESIDGLRAATPSSAVGWVHSICRSRRIDTHRATCRHRACPFEDGSTHAATAEPLSPAVEVAPLVVAAFLERVESHIARTEQSPEARARRRAQAAATLYRTALNESLSEIAMRLDAHVSPELLTKWVERGRSVVIETIEAEGARDPDVADLFEPFAELAARRRIDAGVPRPGRCSRIP